MKIHGQTSYRIFIPILLIICLLGGCMRNPASTMPSKSPDAQLPSAKNDATALDGQDEEYRQKAQAAQKEFDGLCQRLFEENMEESYLTLHYCLKNPEDYGVSDCPKTFGTFSLETMQESARELEELRKALAGIDLDYLTDNQKLTYRILAKSLEYEAAGQGLELYYQPLAPSTGIQAQLPMLLTEFAFYGKQDVEDYLSLLSDMRAYYQQILDFEKEKAAAGLFMTDSCVEQIAAECGGYLLEPEHNLMVSGFDRRIDAMEGLSDEERADFKSRNRTVVAEEFIPAYEQLLQGLEELKGSCTNEQGLCYDSQGKAYYEYLVNAAVGATYPTMDELQKAIEQQIDSDLMDIAMVLKEKPEVSQELAQYEFSETEPEGILELLKQEAQKDFPQVIPYSYVTKYVPEELEQSLSPAFFLVPPLDLYDKCVIYINPGNSAQTQTLFTTLAHEGIPGHLYQNVYFLSHCDSNIRKVLSFLGYSEGWATYVENYSYTVNNGLSPELGRVLARNASATLGIHALMDLNINYYGWSKEQVADYLKKFFDVRQTDVADSIYHAMKNDPSNYMAYYAGYLEIIKMRDAAQSTLKDKFQLIEFHRFLLDIGPAPFTVIEPYFKAWLESYK